MRHTKFSAILGLLFFQLAFFSPVYADVCTAPLHTGNNYIGKTFCENGQVTNIYVIGDFTANNVNLINSACIVGSTNIRGGLIQNGRITGKINLDTTTLYGNTTLIGNISAQNTEITEPLIIYSENATFTGANILSIENKDTQNTTDNIYLINTFVSKNIFFASGRGMIHLKGTSFIGGSVIGGKVIND